MIQTIKELAAIPSITGMPAEGDMPYGRQVHNALEYVLEKCRELGFRTENCENMTGFGEIGEGNELIGILCHLDVVPPGNGWTYDPFVPVVENGKIYGRGVIDDKGPAAAAMFAMKDILDMGIQPKKRIRIIFGLQEESGDWRDIAYYKANYELPDMGFTPDSKFPVIYCEKGIAQYQLTLRGEKKIKSICGGEAANMVADHARCVFEKDGSQAALEEKGRSAHGSRPEEGINAISNMMDQVWQQCPESIFAAWYHEKIGLEYDGTGLRMNLSDESGPLTLNVGRIMSEPGQAAEPDSVDITLEMDVRFPVTYTAEQITKLLAAGAGEGGYDVEIRLKSSEKPVYKSTDDKLITSLMEAYQQETGDDTPPQIIGGGTYARSMDNIVAFGPAFPGEERMEHKADEYAETDKLFLARRIYRTALLKLLEE